MIAQVATDTSLDRVFDYEIPDELKDVVRPGTRVNIEFGRRKIEGIVFSVSETSTHKGKLKPVLGVAGEKPLLSDTLLKLATWMASYYVAPIEACLRTMLPAPVRRADAKFKTRLMIEVTPGWQSPDSATMESGQGKITPRRLEILELLRNTGIVNLTAFCRQWSVSPGTIREMEKHGMVTVTEYAEQRNPLSGRNFLPSLPLALSEEQLNAKNIICDACNDSFSKNPPKPVLLHGVTASGKTEVYLQSIAHVLEKGLGAIVLVPEISLTPQTIQRFASRFGDTVAVLHSQLSDGERHDEWHRICDGSARVVVGPRSAVFAPVDKLGIIIVDEEHEPSYKQDEAPRYNARDIAIMRARYECCTVVLGTATPSLESWNNARKEKYVLVSMTRRAVDMMVPRTEIIDMRAEVAKTGKLPIFSQRLIDATKRRLETGEQVMFFLNRRGYAPNIVCSACGYAEECPDCSVGMIFHKVDNLLRCHICGGFRKVPEACPECSNPDYKYTGVGTQRVESAAKLVFPHAAIERMDADTTSRKFGHQEILDRFRARKIDILIGTQMIAKGLDFPNVTLVGILNADSGLYIPDFRAAERTFQLVAQMAGRSGRGATCGEVLVQTLSPLHPAIVHAKTEDFIGFSEKELAERLELSYPPFTHFVCITFRGEKEEVVSKFANDFARVFGDSEHFICGDPCPAPLAKIKKQWRYQFTLRGEKIRFISRRIRAVMAALNTPSGVHLAVDIDAINSL